MLSSSASPLRLHNSKWESPDFFPHHGETSAPGCSMSYRHRPLPPLNRQLTSARAAVELPSRC